MINQIHFKWTDFDKKEFDEIKQIVSCNTLVIYPDFNKLFGIHMDASDFHLGEFISQEGKPISFYRRKLTGTQTRYTVRGNKLLSIVEIL